MTITAKPWDGSSYPANSWDDTLAALFTDGIIPDLRGEGAMAGATSPITVEAFDAIVNGKHVVSSAQESVAIPTPVSNPRIDIIVARLTYATKAVTLERVAGTEAASPVAPTPTTIDGNVWEFKLGEVRIGTNGATVCTANPSLYIRPRIEVVAAMLAAGILSADATGRALMGSGYFDNATLLAKIAAGAFLANTATRALFANGFVNTALLADAALSADAAGWAKMADRFVTAAKLALNIDGSAIGLIAASADMVDGYHAADLLAGGIMTGTIVMWSGNIGGSDGHRPVVGGVPNEDWHICNGQTVGGLVLPDLRDRFVVGAGNGYSVGDTGGAATVNLNHTHSAGSLAAANAATPEHTHYFSHPGGLAIVSPQGRQFTTGAGYTAALEPHVHQGFSGYTAGEDAPLTHGHAVSGWVTSTLSSTSENRPPYYALYYICKVA